MQPNLSWPRRVCIAATGALIASTAIPAALQNAGASSAVVGIHGAATALAKADRATPIPTPPGTTSGRFETLPPGSSLPGDAECATRVRPAAEIRPANAAANATRGVGATVGSPRVSGNFAGTTDEVLQWVACKWGIDEDVVRAQIAKESWWNHSAGGDRTSNASLCHPSLRGTLPCPESVGLGQVRFQYHSAAFAFDNALRSSAYNLDYTYAMWRECFEGRVGWLNGVERGATYGAGDMWGCVGVWFAGRWYTSAANGYITTVKDLLAKRVWETPAFANG